MRKVYKKKLVITNHQVISMPRGSEILTVQMQGDDICLWFLVDSNEKQTEKRHIHIIGTGYALLDERLLVKYIGTVQMIGGFVSHIFEEACRK